MKIVSGGQTGADEAALEWALENGVPVGGWCPKGRITEEGTIPDCFPLKETPTAKYSQRTEWNVRDSDATVIFTIRAEVSGGSLKTWEFAKKHGKAVLHLSRDPGPGCRGPTAAVLEWERRHVECGRVPRIKGAGRCCFC